MAAKRFNPSDFLLGLTKLVIGVAISLLVISLAGAATARYFLTQLSSLPERPVYDNDSPAKPQVASTDAASTPAPEKPSEDEAPEASTVDDANVLYQVKVTYGSGLLVRSGPGNEYDSVGGVDYDETVDVLEESGERWLKIRVDGLEGWVRGKGNTERLQ
ncbi:SH3 domain-containing protein [Leptothoe sp. PORK10 BA2]|uniref:SH3 domain-containing protein n=1 Tax=Leptothoe sp. PORK10 BA2 TaxID=3110254 RepID=UPI002B1F2A64|nr:SH3 domain-containing protein [Leptothoe sp. PORK10 BA2]MEA5466412.1 SH3 domain-containing protein [Leptothoe sp. PORK10 BA2]